MCPRVTSLKSLLLRVRVPACYLTKIASAARACARVSSLPLDPDAHHGCLSRMPIPDGRLWIAKSPLSLIASEPALAAHLRPCSLDDLSASVTPTDAHLLVVLAGELIDDVASVSIRAVAGSGSTPSVSRDLTPAPTPEPPDRRQTSVLASGAPALAPLRGARQNPMVSFIWIPHLGHVGSRVHLGLVGSRTSRVGGMPTPRVHAHADPARPISPTRYCPPDFACCRATRRSSSRGI